MHVKSLIAFAGWIPVSCNATPSSSSTAAIVGGSNGPTERKLADSGASSNRQSSSSFSAKNAANSQFATAANSVRSTQADWNLNEEDDDLKFGLINNLKDLSFNSVMPHYHENVMHIRDPNYRFSGEARKNLAHLYGKKQERRLEEYGRPNDAGSHANTVARRRTESAEEPAKSSVYVMSDGNSEIYIDDGVDNYLEAQRSADKKPVERRLTEKNTHGSANSVHNTQDNGNRVHAKDSSTDTHRLYAEESFKDKISQNHRKPSVLPNEDYEVVEFADGSSIIRPIELGDQSLSRMLQASNLVRNIWSTHKVRRLSDTNHEKYANETLSTSDWPTNHWHSSDSERVLARVLAMPTGRRLIDIDNDYSVQHFDVSDPRYVQPENSLVEGHKRLLRETHRRQLQIPGGVQVDNTFSNLPFRHPQQCERKQCLPPTSANCKEHLRGFYLKERGCADASDGGIQTCTACQYARSLDQPTICQCEKILFTRPSDYNQPCDSSRHCTSGECFRPCEFFLHVSTCPLERCLWNTTSHSCVLLPQALVYDKWATMISNDTDPLESERGKKIVMMTPESVFPMTFDGLLRATENYLIQGKKLTELTNTVSLFQRLDKNFDGFITAHEFEELLTTTLVELENEALLQTKYALLPGNAEVAEDVSSTKVGENPASASMIGDGRVSIGGTSRLLEERARRDGENEDKNSFNAGQDGTTPEGEESTPESKGIPMKRVLKDADGRALQSNVAPHQETSLSPDSCLKEVPPMFYCSISLKCVTSCSACGWKSVEDTEFFICVNPSAESCAAVNMYFCGTDELCVTSCANCVGRRILDSSQKTCLSPWWYEQPTNDVSTWVCRHRRKVGRSCIHDQDCIYGMRKCSKIEGISSQEKQCLPLKPYEETHVCSSHLDCPHINYYCPDDPTGNDKYWPKYCRRQLGEGRRCTSDVQCQVDMMCNTKEIPSPRCRKFFSLPLGHLAKDPLLCSTVWHNANYVCAYPAKSKNVGRPCTSYLNCQTTDPTGTFGECQCKDWWDSGNSKYCMPVPGDYDNHLEKLRDLVEFQTTYCGKFWTDEECKEEFGDKAINYFNQLLCEYDQLSKGPYLPELECDLGDGGGRYLDPCQDLKQVKKVTGKEGAEGLNSGERKFAISIVALVLAMVLL